MLLTNKDYFIHIVSIVFCCKNYDISFVEFFFIHTNASFIWFKQ